jgi:YidC/Oxa1 family membrane protein insertase
MLAFYSNVPSLLGFSLLRVNNAPPLGWDDTLAFLILPVFLVISQFVSMELMQPKTQDPSQQQTNLILKVLPIMIGWFALNVPAALSVYWVVNNIVTTATSVIIRNTMKVEPIKTGGGAAAAAVRPPTTIFAPPPQKPSGFGSSSSSSGPKIPRDVVKPITAIDAEIMSPPSPDSSAYDASGDDDTVSEMTTDNMDPSASKKKRGKKRKNN